MPVAELKLKAGHPPGQLLTSQAPSVSVPNGGPAAAPAGVAAAAPATLAAPAEASLLDLLSDMGPPKPAGDLLLLHLTVHYSCVFWSVLYFRLVLPSFFSVRLI